MAKLFFFLTIMISSFALANTSLKKCQTAACSDTRKVLNPSELPATLKSKLQEKAEELAGIWGDTILEGDYYADDQVNLEVVEELTRAGALEAYRITYSSKAWDTSNCQFDSNDLSTLNDCEAGRIVESGYISGDFKSLQRDPEAIANFQKGSR